jgi:thiamine biosynthesis lipoprotein
MVIKPTGFVFILALFLIVCITLVGCEDQSESQLEFALGTICRVNLFEGGNKQTYSRIFARIREIDRTMTMFPGEFEDLISGAGILDRHSEAAAKFQSATETLVSGVVAINRNAGLEPVHIRADLIELLETALYYAELSDGAFDPTIGPLVRLWGIGTDSERVPREGEIAQALKLVNWRDLIIDRESGTAFLRREGMALDLGAIAKGYAGDEALRIAKEAKVKRAVIDLGGNIVTLGGREQKGKTSLPWRIGIQNPLMGRGSYIGVVPVNDMSVVTSGVYERHFESGGKSYHHLLSTANGYPVENGLLSATIVTKSSTAADALSTVAFTLGFEQGKAVIDSIPGAEAIFVFNDHSVISTSGLEEIFKLTDSEFTLYPAQH